MEKTISNLKQILENISNELLNVVTTSLTPMQLMNVIKQISDVLQVITLIEKKN